MSDHSLHEAFLHFDQLLPLALLQTGHRNAGPGGNNFGHIILRDFLPQELSPSLLGQLLVVFLQFGRDFGNPAVLDFTRFGEITLPLGQFKFIFQLLDLLGQFAGFGNLLFFVLPLGLELGALFLEIGQLLFQFGEPLLARRVFFLFQGGALHFVLHDLTLQLVEFGRHGIQFDLQARCRLVDEIDRFVRQKPVADVAVAHHRGTNQGTVLDPHAMVHLIAFFQSAQDGNGIFHAGLLDHDRLEAAFESGILLDVFPVFVERGGADGPKLAPGQLRLEHVGSVGRPLGRAGSDNGMQFVDEEDDLPFARGNFFEERFEALLEFAAEFCPGNHRADIHGHQLLVLERLGHIPADNAAGQTFDDGRFAHPGFADEHRVVFGAARKNLHGPADFLVAADDRVDLPPLGQLGQIAAVFLQSLVFLLGILVGDTLRTAHLNQRLDQFVVRRAIFLEQLGRGIRAPRQGQQVVLGTEILILELLHDAFGRFKGPAQIVPEVRLGRVAGNSRTAVEFGLELLAQPRGGDADLLQQRNGHALSLVKQGEQELLVADFLLVKLACDVGSGAERLLHLLGEAVRSHQTKKTTTTSGGYACE